MKDNDQTANLGALIDAGVRSFKIEGRYKDMSYVKNITAHYRQMLDAIIDDRGDLARASAGRTEHFFIPSTDKTFHRGSTDYFVNARKGDIGAFDSPKFIGLPVGEVLKVAKDHLDVQVTEPLANGDGLNVMIKREVVGFRANTVEKTGENRYRVWPNEMPADLYKARPNAALNRNRITTGSRPCSRPPASAALRWISRWGLGRAADPDHDLRRRHQRDAYARRPVRGGEQCGESAQQPQGWRGEAGADHLLRAQY